MRTWRVATAIALLATSACGRIAFDVLGTGTGDGGTGDGHTNDGVFSDGVAAVDSTVMAACPAVSWGTCSGPFTMPAGDIVVAPDGSAASTTACNTNGSASYSFGSAVIVEVTSVLSAPDGQTVIQMGDAATFTEFLPIIIGQGQVKLPSGLMIPYDPNLMRWFRVRIPGPFIIETSPDAATWTMRDSFTYNLMGNLYVEVFASIGMAEPSPGTARFGYVGFCP